MLSAATVLGFFSVSLVLRSEAAPIGTRGQGIETIPLERLLKASSMSAAAYCATGHIQDWDCKPCERTYCSSVKFDSYIRNATDIFPIFGYSAHDDSAKEIYIVFRGTMNDEDMLRDANYEQVSVLRQTEMRAKRL